MRTVLYIGINSPGSTSRMRAEKIHEILEDWEIEVIDTEIPTMFHARVWRSIGFRYKVGPLISTVNNYIIKNLRCNKYDLIWVDKAIYLTEETTKQLRNRTEILVHFTPDPAFTFHRSKLFLKSLSYYDYAITTKSYEIDDYAEYLKDSNKVIYATQGFDKLLHRPTCEFRDKTGISFIGHWEKEREKTIKAILNTGINVKLAGIKWKKFVNNNPMSNLQFLGDGVFGEDYVKTISSSLFSLGSVSKWIPEKHTTRTFEIPACATALVTEWNEEIAGFFTDDEVIYYNNEHELVEKLNYYTQHKDLLESLIRKGYDKVQTGGYDYRSIIENILKRIVRF